MGMPISTVLVNIAEKPEETPSPGRARNHLTAMMAPKVREVSEPT